MNTGTERLIGKREPPTGWVIFNNPARRNAVSIDMWEAIVPLLERFEADREIRVVIVTGAGDRAFVSGADLSQFGDKRATPEDNKRYSAISNQARAAIRELNKPTIAMINGSCMGGGVSVALSCDLRVAAADARFGIPAAKLGIGYGFSSVQRLVEVVGPAYAKEILFTAREITADEALRMGLVNRVVPREQLETTVREYADMIAANAPLTIRAGKLAVNQALLPPQERQMSKVEAAIDACFASEDYREGRQAFKEKRKPEFKGV